MGWSCPFKAHINISKHVLWSSWWTGHNYSKYPQVSSKTSWYDWRDWFYLHWGMLSFIQDLNSKDSIGAYLSPSKPLFLPTRLDLSRWMGGCMVAWNSIIGSDILPQVWPLFSDGYSLGPNKKTCWFSQSLNVAMG